MSKTYQVNAATHMRDALLMTLLRAGVNMGTTSLLTVRGRKSGQPHTVPVIPVEQDGHRFLIARRLFQLGQGLSKKEAKQN
jgi:hypothetical protein